MNPGYVKVKEICTNRFEVTLTQINDKYMIEFVNTRTDARDSSELIADYHMASYLFDLKVDELTGN